MRIEQVTDKTLDEFLRCLKDKDQEDPRQTEIRRQWYNEHRQKGLFAGWVKSPDNSTVGLFQTIPIEYSPLAGQDLMVILCLWIHSYVWGVGVQQGKGLGRLLIDSLEEQARSTGAKGIAAWGIDWEVNWMPASFFRHIGYEQADSEDKVKVFWKPFSRDAQPPRLKRLPVLPAPGKDKVNVLVAANGWCLGCYKYLYARDALKGLEDIVDYTECAPPEKAAYLHLGLAGGIFLDGKVVQPYEICTPESIRTKIKQMHKKKAAKNTAL